MISGETTSKPIAGVEISWTSNGHLIIEATEEGGALCDYDAALEISSVDAVVAVIEAMLPKGYRLVRDP